MELVIFAAFAAVFIQSDNMFPDLRNHEQEIIAKHLKCHYNQGQQPITESVAIFVDVFVDVFANKLFSNAKFSFCKQRTF